MTECCSQPSWPEFSNYINSEKKLLFPPKGTICPRKRTYRFTLNYCVFAAQQRSTKETENVIERDVICPCLARTFNRSSLFLKLANIYSLLERLKMILHKLITIGLSSCEISARDYSHSGLSFMIGTPRKQPAPTDGRLFLVKAL